MREIDFKKALVDFISRLKYASHILPLLEDESVSVMFCSPDQNEISMFIKGKEIWLENNCDRPSLIIRGNSSVLLQLVEGRTKLQVLQKRDEISVEGKFRYILKLESLLYCCSIETMPSLN